MDETSVGLSLKAGRFLGSKDRVLVAGNGFNGTAVGNKSSGTTVQVLYSKFDNEVDGPSHFVPTSELNLNGRCSDLELCGVPRLAKTFAAVTKSNPNTGAGSISLIDVETSISSSILTEIEAKGDLTSQSSSFCPYSAITFDSNTEILAAATEAGEVILWDMYSGKEISRTIADACGVNKLKFLKTGQLVTVGNSVDCQIKLWDLKVAPTSWTTVFSRGLCKNYQSSSNYASHPSKRHPRYTSLLCHPVQDKIISGTATGSMVVWDLRSEVPVEHQVQSSRITDSIMHPRQIEHIVSASTDGTVNCFNMNYSTANLGVFGSLPSTAAHSDVNTLLTEPASINSLDYDLDSRVIMAVSSLGSFYRMQL